MHHHARQPPARQPLPRISRNSLFDGTFRGVCDLISPRLQLTRSLLFVNTAAHYLLMASVRFIRPAVKTLRRRGLGKLLYFPTLATGITTKERSRGLHFHETDGVLYQRERRLPPLRRFWVGVLSALGRGLLR